MNKNKHKFLTTLFIFIVFILILFINFKQDKTSNKAYFLEEIEPAFFIKRFLV